ncbi:MAG: hypothetical protein ABIG11_03800 [bacterium]
MCGIAGTLSLGKPLQEPEHALVRNMVDTLSHCGPDSRHVLCDEYAALGSARLRVTDLRQFADMPMRSDDGSLWLTYNGAITGG